MSTLSRRRLLIACATGPILSQANSAEVLPKIVVHKDPTCGCCTAWAAHVRQAGFPVEVIETGELNRVKARLGVPQNLAACHTAEINGYVLEGHVPASAIRRLLVERPEAKGLAVPGMPVGSPGMEVEGSTPETYQVTLFGPSGQKPFATYRGERQI